MSNIVRMCFNWKVLSALAVLGLGVWIAAPGLLGAALPLLLVALCPLSMLLMMRRMQGDRDEPQRQPETQVASAGTREDRLEQLRDQLSSVHVQRENITQKIRRLELDGPSENGPRFVPGETEQSKRSPLEHGG
ncbi:MAG: DUF2933 domain-containing protein [Actinomycetota bacterium]